MDVFRYKVCLYACMPLHVYVLEKGKTEINTTAENAMHNIKDDRNLTYTLDSRSSVVFYPPSVSILLYMNCPH